MAERVVVSEFPSRLRFEILKTPPAMRELNPFGPVHARHLTEGYTGRWGEIQLKSVPGGKTKIIATSAYGLRIEPIEYWSLWSDEIVHGVHHQVFDEIERRLASN